MQAFAGIKVLDLTHVLAGPFSTFQLAALGADVLKIERADQSDMNREIGAVGEFNHRYMGTHFQSQSGNKRAMTLNLKAKEGREIFLALAKLADVIVENYRSGAMQRMGLGYDDVRAINPGIIYCSITGFGQTGPKRSHAAFDNAIQAYSGLMAATGKPGEPVLVGPPVLDYGTGCQAAFAIASALFRRERSGEGQYIDVAMLDAALMLMTCNAVNYSLTGRVGPPVPYATQTFAGYGCYMASDTWLAIGAVTPDQVQRLWRLLGRDDLADEIAGKRIPDMERTRDRDKALLEEILKTKTAAEWEELFNEVSLPAARMRTIDEALESEQVASRQVVGDPLAADDDGRSFRPTVAAFECTPDGPSVSRRPPRLGEHTAEVLAELGYDAASIEEFRQRDVI